MSVLGMFKAPLAIADEVPENHFLVVHPLDDQPETKIDTTNLGAMPMTPSVKYSLFALRGYLVLMMLLVLYHVLDLAGLFGHHQEAKNYERRRSPEILVSRKRWS